MSDEEYLADIDAARAKVAGQVAAAEARHSAVAQLAQEVVSLTVTVHSPRGEVTVMARPSGQVISVVFDQKAESLEASALSAVVTETIAKAQHRAAMDAVDQSARILGESSPIVGQLRSEAASAYPEPGRDTIEYS